jgi:predicted transcriptional regulator of viral defense system
MQINEVHMQRLTEAVYRLEPPGGLFDESVVLNLFPEASLGARRVLVHRAASRGEILRLKPGYYCLAPEFRKRHPHPFAVAAVLHWPSHVSLESALAYHGLIPEAVQTVSSVTPQRSRDFPTPLGHFSFRRVVALNPSAGVVATRVAEDSWARIATPLRAMADLIYLRKEVCWGRDGPRFLTGSMRIAEEDLRAIAADAAPGVMEAVKSERVRNYLRNLVKEFGP